MPVYEIQREVACEVVFLEVIEIQADSMEDARKYKGKILSEEVIDELDRDYLDVEITSITEVADD